MSRRTPYTIVVLVAGIASGCSGKPAVSANEALSGADPAAPAAPTTTPVTERGTAVSARRVRTPVPDAVLAREQKAWDMQQAQSYGGPPLAAPPQVMDARTANQPIGPIAEEYAR